MTHVNRHISSTELFESISLQGSQKPYPSMLHVKHIKDAGDWVLKRLHASVNKLLWYESLLSSVGGFYSYGPLRRQDFLLFCRFYLSLVNSEKQQQQQQKKQTKK